MRKLKVRGMTPIPEIVSLGGKKILIHSHIKYVLLYDITREEL